MRAIGIGVPGVVKKGIVKNIPTIKSWEGINLENLIKSKYNTKLFIENDTNITTIGIYQKQYKEKYKNMALMYLENGIGSGIVINDELYLGSTNFAGELNYLNIEFGKYNSNNLNLEEYMYLVYLVVILLMTIRL
ncbi:ROK family protein [Clostridioides difficile]|nr:ROK family protein [Clostridioides difficile]MCA5557139.1 ROK family protein [Clostridioides difficile]MCB4292814.1 ROK family protein [Clostridioides difficile]MDS6364200.1 ROK family protein [Clostridioides difficile]MDS6375480.1 ROK family protein [Clostridioides difficile]MDS6423193.1 ROK family protein [Clostridioides difficile]